MQETCGPLMMVTFLKLLVINFFIWRKFVNFFEKEIWTYEVKRGVIVESKQNIIIGKKSYNIKCELITFRAGAEVKSEPINSSKALVKIHKMHHKNHSVLKFNLNIKLKWWTTSQKNHLRVATLVFNLSFQQNKKPYSPITFNHNVYTYNEAASHKDFSVHSDRFESYLWLLWYARLYWFDDHNENDGRYQGFQIGRKIVLGTGGSFQYVIKALFVTKNCQNTKTILYYDTSLCSMRKQSLGRSWATYQSIQSSCIGKASVSAILQNDRIHFIKTQYCNSTE